MLTNNIGLFFEQSLFLNNPGDSVCDKHQLYTTNKVYEIHKILAGLKQTPEHMEK